MSEEVYWIWGIEDLSLWIGFPTEVKPDMGESGIVVGISSRQKVDSDRLSQVVMDNCGP